MKPDISYYQKNREKMKASAMKYYKDNRLIINHGVDREKNPDLHEWYIKDASNAVFKIRHGSFSIKEDLHKYFFGEKIIEKSMTKT